MHLEVSVKDKVKDSFPSSSSNIQAIPKGLVWEVFEYDKQNTYKVQGHSNITSFQTRHYHTLHQMITIVVDTVVII